LKRRAAVSESYRYTAATIREIAYNYPDMPEGYASSNHYDLFQCIELKCDFDRALLRLPPHLKLIVHAIMLGNDPETDEQKETAEDVFRSMARILNGD
jgi:hypothetical protein